MVEENKTLSLLTEYCTGCGLCHSVENVSFVMDGKGFSRPNLILNNVPLCRQICPSYCTEARKETTPWGEYVSAYLGWANDTSIRYKGSSGGVLTALCCYLLDTGKVDGIIQTRASKDTPYETETMISCSREEVIACAGSRYSMSAPLYDILQRIETTKRYVFVGKPCDVYALRQYMKQHTELEKNIKYLFSFFCAGVPSEMAQKKLLKRLGSTGDLSECRLQYRGNGWPGSTELVCGIKTTSISYEESWGSILGRNVRKACRFCIDGVGEYADLVCADAWYMDNGVVSFQENEGRNIIFARNKGAEQLLKEVSNKEYILLQKNDEYVHSFSNIQKYQLERRGTMKASLQALRLFGREVPMYNKQTLTDLAGFVTFQQRARRFAGTAKRIWQKKL